MKFKRATLMLTSLAIMSSMCACGGFNKHTGSGEIKGAGENAGIEANDNEGIKGAHVGNLDGFMAGPEAGYTEPSDEFSEITETGFIETKDNAVSTFSVDVDTASYQLIKTFINDNIDIDENAVRIEEMLNSFKYDYDEPTNGDPLALTTKMYDCPWNENNMVVQLGLQAEKIDMSNREPLNLVFLIDTSGSMSSDNKLGLIKKSLEKFVYELSDNDTVSIVTYAGSTEVKLDGAKGSEPDKIMEVIDSLMSDGGTYGEGGIEMAYEVASKYECDNNRVVLLTDGDFNIGMSGPDELEELIKEKAKSGIELSVFGVGYGNLKDDTLEALADNGNGNYGYIGDLTDANKCLVESFGGTFYTVAKDVKLQAEFNPDVVKSYRLIGYENRVLNEEDFEDDTVDAGEIGSGHTVTAMYEIELAEGATEGKNLFKLGMRFKEPKGDTSDLREFEVALEKPEKIDRDLAFACSVVEFGMDLRNSEFKGTTSYESIKDLLSKSDIQDKDRSEFVKIVDKYYKNIK